MTTIGCPLCELRFSNSAERDWHVETEHPGAIRRKDEYDPVEVEDLPEGDPPPA